MLCKVLKQLLHSLLPQLLQKVPCRLPPTSCSPLQRQVQQTVEALVVASRNSPSRRSLRAEAEHRVGCLYTVDILVSNDIGN